MTKLSHITEQTVQELDQLFSVINDSGTITDKEMHSARLHDLICTVLNSIASHPEDLEGSVNFLCMSMT
ncbi:hypothetical protein [Bacillus sp. KH172YL63]|uniref:hypothetical protein n=1 Tax=Bacillus sp. KH172YL63 TaxID=2709784 RepID=UPI0013E4B87C|nr:hypothetical protein [Bacillus sp. KH172YL63]BCB03502.1 hypothetical protein KH172YL63_16350 [Bacillus sp. KH172YL63]